MAALVQSEHCVVDIHETFPKQTFRNRYSIFAANGILDLNVPVHKPGGNHTKTSEVLISSHAEVFSQHITALESAYRSSPYFEFFFDDVLQFFKGQYNTLVELNTASLQCIGTILRHNFHVECTRQFISPSANTEEIMDFRTLISPKTKHFYEFPASPYYQVFAQKHGFRGNLSILDLIFHIGPESFVYLQSYPLKQFVAFLKK